MNISLEVVISQSITTTTGWHQSPDLCQWPFKKLRGPAQGAWRIVAVGIPTEVPGDHAVTMATPKETWKTKENKGYVHYLRILRKGKMKILKMLKK